MTSLSTPDSSSTANSTPQVVLMGANNNNVNQIQSLIAINSTQVPIKLTKMGELCSLEIPI